MPSPRFGKFFSRGEKTEFSPVTPTTPNWQSTAYEGVTFESANIGMQQQYPKKESNVAIEEVTSPAPTYASMGDDYGTSSPTAWQMETTRGASHLGNLGGDTMRAVAIPRTRELETVVSNARSQEPNFEAVRQPGARFAAPIPEPPSMSVSSAPQPASTEYGIAQTTQPRPQYPAAPQQHFQQVTPMKYNETPPQPQDQYFRQPDTYGDAEQPTVTSHTPKQQKWSFNRMATRLQDLHGGSRRKESANPENPQQAAYNMNNSPQRQSQSFSVVSDVSNYKAPSPHERSEAEGLLQGAVPRPVIKRKPTSSLTMPGYASVEWEDN